MTLAHVFILVPALFAAETHKLPKSPTGALVVGNCDGETSVEVPGKCALYPAASPAPFTTAPRFAGVDTQASTELSRPAGIGLSRCLELEVNELVRSVVPDLQQNHHE